MDDPILKEVQEAKRSMMEEFDNDLHKLFAFLYNDQEKNKQRGAKYVSFSSHCSNEGKHPEKDREHRTHSQN